MIKIDIPGNRIVQLEHLVLDVNGTLALDGLLLPCVADQLNDLRHLLNIHMLTADTHGCQKVIDAQLGIQASILPPTTSETSQRYLKAAYVERLGADTVVAVGNGNNDSSMIESAALGIAILGPEGLSKQAMLASDVVCANINDALALLLNPDRLRATLRI